MKMFKVTRWINLAAMGAYGLTNEEILLLLNLILMVVTFLIDYFSNKKEG